MYKFTEAAAGDVEDILNQSLIDFGAQQTEAYYTSLTQCLDLLEDNPEMGGAADEIRPGYRRFPHESHIIFYTVDAEDILIVRILHKRMDALRNL
jgi:toxin ParE1/3/4